MGTFSWSKLSLLLLNKPTTAEQNQILYVRDVNKKMYLTSICTKQKLPTSNNHPPTTRLIHISNAILEITTQLTANSTAGLTECRNLNLPLHFCRADLFYES